MPFLSSLLQGESCSITGSDNEVNWECFGWESTVAREHCHGNHERTEILFWALSNIRICPTLQAVEALPCRHWSALKQSMSNFVCKAKGS